MKRSDLENHLADLNTLGDIRTVISAIESGKATKVGIGVDGSAPFKPMTVLMATKHEKDAVKNILNAVAEELERKLKAAGIEP